MTVEACIQLESRLEGSVGLLESGLDYFLSYFLSCLLSYRPRLPLLFHSNTSGMCRFRCVESLA